MHIETWTGKTCKITAALALVVISFLPLSAFALDPGKNLRKYVLRTWTTEQGLPQNTIHAMLQTQDGFLWIGTRGGLARFDGASFILYKAGAPDSVPGESITSTRLSPSVSSSSFSPFVEFGLSFVLDMTKRVGLRPVCILMRVSNDKSLEVLV